MKSILWFALATSILSTTAIVAEETKGQVIQFDHEKVAAAFEKGGPILNTNAFKIQAGRRIAPGEVEIHEHDTDIFYILEGTATFVTGGKAAETRVVGAGETRAKEIVGGESRHLVKGDIIVIPTSVPHWFKEINGLFRYYVVKVTDQKH